MQLFELLGQETTITYSDLKLLLFCIPAFCLYRILVSKFLLIPLSKHVVEKNRYKFVHRGFDCIHYFTSAILGTLAFLQRPYAHCPFYFVDCLKFIICTGDNCVCSLFEKIYYFYFVSYYLSDVFWISTTKDIKMLVFHHTITIVMVVCTAVCARPASGLSTMVLHDWSDIFLYSGKISSYLNWKKASDMLLLIFAGSFIYLRLFNVLVIVWAIFADPTPQPHHSKFWLFGRSLMFGLYMCHIIWGYQIIKALVNIFKGDKIRDTRSDELKKSKKE